MKNTHPFEEFLTKFIPQVSCKNKQLNQAEWLLETTGSSDAADLKAALNTELRLLFNNRETYDRLLEWSKDQLENPILKRELNVLIRAHKKNMIPENLLKELSQKEAELSLTYTNFRPKLDDQPISDNEIRNILKKENNPERRKKTWEVSKEIGQVLAPQIIHLVKLRNQAAQSLGYQNFFAMELDLQEVNEEWLFNTLDDLAKRSDDAYTKMLHEINDIQSRRFNVSPHDMGPWAWCEPFGQEDPLDSKDLDALVQNVDLCQASLNFYRNMGVDVKPILDVSDMYERPGKNQHAFCTNIDRGNDVRTLNNVKPTQKWLETILHELGHAIYELGYDKSLPWLLREPPHMITTEAMALIAGRQAYLYDGMKHLLKINNSDSVIKKSEESLRRRQLIFSRWVLVMSYFERELYRNPDQDLNKLWWQLVEKYQKITPPKNREGKNDWAAKYHIGLAPVYYFSYLLGEMFASSMMECLVQQCGTKDLATDKSGKFFNEKLFKPGNSMSWFDLIKHVTGSPLTADAWIHQFASV